MPSEIRIKRLQKLALQRASQVVLYELHDPRLTFLTLTRVKLASDLSHAVIFWSTMAEGGDRSKAQHALDDASGPVSRAIAKSFDTRRSPRVKFQFDESIAGAIRVSQILDGLKADREALEEATEGETDAVPGSDEAPSDEPQSDTPQSDKRPSDDTAADDTAAVDSASDGSTTA